jgi:hypothetical protein
MNIRELHKKYTEEIALVLPTIINFNKENLAIKKIGNYLSNKEFTKFESTDFDYLSYEIWKFYRAFKMKEFILLYHDRIKAEIKCIDSTSNKTIEMLDRAFLWPITNWSGDSKRKYKQRFYSESALKNFNINKVSYLKLSIADKNILIDLINENNNDSLFQHITSNPKKEEKENNDNIELEILNYLDEKKPTLLCFIGTKKIEEFKSLIHAFACQADSKIQLDHVLNRITIKNYIEKLCNSFNDEIENQDIVDEINNAVDIILPYMFGSVVHKDENDKLKSDLKIDENLHSNIWKVYIDAKIRMYDFDTNSANGPSLIDECEYKNIKINNPYDSMVLCDTEYKWCLSNEWV